MSETSVIEELLARPFSVRAFEEQLYLIGRRPRPEMPNLKMQHKVRKLNANDYVRHFSVTQYDKITWLTGCPKKNKLFCWYCLLFKNDLNNGIWNNDGFSDLNHMSSAVIKHERSQRHARNFLKWAMFGKQKIDVQLDEHRRLDNVHNEQVRKNREILKRLIQVICLFGKQELPFYGCDEEADSSNMGNVHQFLKTMREFDPVLDNHLQTSAVFRDTLAIIIQNVIKSVVSVIMDEIKKQINESYFVSIILDETTDVVNESQLSTVLRYVYKGKTYERFINFTDVSADRSADGLFNHITEVVRSFQIEKKLIGQSFDGASIMVDNLKYLKTKISEKYPQAVFTHCYAHDVNLVLQQSLNNIQECRIFSQALSRIAAFFNESIKHIFALHTFAEKMFPDILPTRWNFTSKLVGTVEEHRTKLITFFTYCTENSGDWDSDSIVKFLGFLKFLQKPETVFLLKLLSEVFCYTDALYDTLKTKPLDFLYCGKKVKESLSAFQDLGEYSFDNIWESVNNLDLDSNEPRPKVVKREPDDLTKEESYRNLFYEIVDNVHTQLAQRFSSIENLEYFNLLCCEQFDTFNNKFPDDQYAKLVALYTEEFDFLRLKNELAIVYLSEEFQNKSVQEIVDFMYKNNLNIGLKEVSKLAELILSIPAITASVETSCSYLKRIKTYNRSTQGRDQLPGLELLSIEKNLLTLLQESRENFYELCINTFLKQQQGIDFLYK